ncbi:MAG: FixH family protein [Candidatus Rokuibacteriota bacterium]
MPKRWIGLVALGLIVLTGEAGGHKLPSFPQVQLLGAEADAPLVRRLTVEVRDPAGKEPVLGADVTVRALHADVGSGLRMDPVRLGPAAAPGTYQGTIRFPLAGRWELTIEVVGRYVGDAHLALEVTAPVAAEGGPRLQKPDLPLDFLTVRHLAIEWGHLGGFALWLLATGVGLLDPAGRRRFVLAATWAAFAVEGTTGLYKMEFSTPFATPLRLFRLDRLPRVFFAEEYVSTLVVKHVLMVVAMAVTLALTVHAWRTKPGAGVRLWRALLGVNLLLALAIAGAAAVLRLYHGIVLHFS